MRRAGEVVLGRLVAVDHSPVHDGVQSPVERASPNRLNRRPPVTSPGRSSRDRAGTPVCPCHRPRSPPPSDCPRADRRDAPRREFVSVAAARLAGSWSRYLHPTPARVCAQTAATIAPPRPASDGRRWGRGFRTVSGMRLAGRRRNSPAWIGWQDYPSRSRAIRSRMPSSVVSTTN